MKKNELKVIYSFILHTFIKIRDNKKYQRNGGELENKETTH